MPAEIIFLLPLAIMIFGSIYIAKNHADKK